MNDMTPDQRFDKLLREVVQSTRSPVPEEQRLARLLKEFRALHARPSLLQRLRCWLTQPHLVPVPAMAFVALLVVAQSVALLKQMPADEDQRETYRGTAIKCEDGPRIRVVFKPDAPQTEVVILLRKVEATVTAGPSETGELWLTIAKGRPIEESKKMLMASAWVNDAIIVEPSNKGCPK